MFDLIGNLGGLANHGFGAANAVIDAPPSEDVDVLTIG